MENLNNAGVNVDTFLKACVTDNETWMCLDFLGFPNNYVSKFGDVITTNRRGTGEAAFLTKSLDKDRYETVNLCYKGKHKSCKVHRLVALCFIPNPDKLPQVNHIGGDKSDNRYFKLEWCTNQDNALHAHRVLEDYEERVKRMHAVLDDYANGMSQAAIMRKYKISATYVHRMVVKGDVSIAR